MSYSHLSDKDEISGFLDNFFEYIENFLYVHLFQKDADISSIKKFIDINYKQPNLSLALLANHFYINKSYLATTFKEQTVQTVMDYIRVLRVDEVKKYLQGTQLSISEIAPLCGFQTVNKLFTHFKEQTGLPPMEWRKRHDL